MPANNANKTDIFDEMKIADEFNNFSGNIGTGLANKIPDSPKPLDSYLTRVITKMESQSLSMKDAFFSL